MIQILGVVRKWLHYFKWNEFYTNAVVMIGGLYVTSISVVTALYFGRFACTNFPAYLQCAIKERGRFHLFSGSLKQYLRKFSSWTKLRCVEYLLLCG